MPSPKGRPAAAPHRTNRDFRLPALLCKHSSRRHLLWAFLALGMIACRVALLPLLPIPQPAIHDEFSYLLAADTFAHARVVNPPLAHPEFFESMHILVNPVYVSKYPPGQGLMLALGQTLFGHPYWGVVLEGALMIFLFCWTADAWLPPQWSLIGGALAAVLFFVRHYWFQSYWGGALAACGGALVVGCLGHALSGRLKQTRFTLGLGAATLFFTRPFEGGVLCLGVLAWLIVYAWRLSAPARRHFVRVLVASNLALLLAAAALAGWYNLRVTGRATMLPYQLYQRQADSTPLFWILPPPPQKQYAYASLRNEHRWEWDTYRNLRQLPVWRAVVFQFLLFLLTGVWQQFLAFGLLLFAVPWARTRAGKKGKRCLVFLAGIGVVALVTETFSMAHYSAPFTPVLLLLIVASGRALWYRLARIRRGALAIAALAGICSLFLVFDYQRAFMAPHETERSRFIKRLEAVGGRHLVFVDYAQGWQGWMPDGEWIYNGADLQHSPIVFAHLRADAENRTLIQQYAGRDVWLVKLGPGPAEVSVRPYEALSPGQSTAALESRTR